MNDEDQSELLDAEFRQILYVIKPLISGINDHYRLEKYRIWLERLSVVHHTERLERNKYLLALANQIHDGVLQSPFTTTPPKGFLPPLAKLKMMIPSDEDITRMSRRLYQKKTEEFPHVGPRHSDPVEQPSIKRTRAEENIDLSQRKKLVKASTKAALPFKKIGKAASTGQGVRTQESSWYDLSDTSPGDTDREDDAKKFSLQHKVQGLKVQEHFLKKYEDEVKKSSKESVSSEGKKFKVRKEQVVGKCNDDNGRRKSKESVPIKEKSAKQNILLQEQLVRRNNKKDNVEEPQESFTAEDVHKTQPKIKINILKDKDWKPVQKPDDEENSSRGSTPSEDKSPRATEQELDALKMRMMDLLEVKHALRDTHYLTEDRKKTVDALQMKVTRLEQQNMDLQTLLNEQQKKFLDLDQFKSKELSSFKEKFAYLKQKEIEGLRQQYKKEMCALEKSHSSKILELEAQIATLKQEYDNKIKTVKESSGSLVKLKEEEIEQLQNHLKAKAAQLANEGNSEQIISLKRCISKLDKVLHKNEKDYVKKMERLKKELEVKDMTNQMQLQTQRADLIVRHAATKQEELKSALNSLEGKYKKLMDNLQTRALDTKKQDDKLIEDLRILLDHNNILYMI